jgi:3-hydroxybutyryl-CoA dehydrogenase
MGKMCRDEPIAVVGAGTMGLGIAQVAVLAGHPVCVVDTAVALLERGREILDRNLNRLVDRGGLDVAQKSAAISRVRWDTDLSAAAGSALLIEAIVERFEAKAALFAAAEDRLGPDIILASNTSSLSIRTMAAELAAPQRFLGLHFFNPVPAMELVEVIAGPSTEAGVIGAVFDLMRHWRKRPVIVRDVPGFIVNRVARPFYAEAFAALEEGVDAAAIDHALTGAGGFRMGPLALADMIGNDVNFMVATSIFDAYAGQTRFRPQAAQRALVEEGNFGRKTGQGVYRYDGAGSARAAADFEPSPPAPARVAFSCQPSALSPLQSAAELAGLQVDRDPALAADRITIDGFVCALSDGRLLSERSDVALLLDWARDFSTATLLPFTAVSPDAARAFTGLAQALGRAALWIPDRPGLIVLRTLAQLANAAADAVADEISSPDGIDEAMIYGANQPDGPLAWARAFGPGRLADVLDNITQASADEMYRPAPLFRAGALYSDDGESGALTAPEGRRNPAR